MEEAENLGQDVEDFRIHDRWMFPRSQERFVLVVCIRSPRIISPGATHRPLRLERLGGSRALGSSVINAP